MSHLQIYVVFNASLVNTIRLGNRWKVVDLLAELHLGVRVAAHLVRQRVKLQQLGLVGDLVPRHNVILLSERKNGNKDDFVGAVVRRDRVGAFSATPAALAMMTLRKYLLLVGGFYFLSVLLLLLIFLGLAL